MQGESRSPYETVVLEAGIEEGHRRGLEEGLQAGRQEGRQEGRCAAAREILLDVLAARFGACDESMLRTVELVSDPERLRRLAQLALRATSLGDVWRDLSKDQDVARG
jgi:flagellar biosynthesis/type III secretory pathway protein FliH